MSFGRTSSCGQSSCPRDLSASAAIRFSRIAGVASSKATDQSSRQRSSWVHLDPEDTSAGFAHNRRQPINRGHDVAGGGYNRVPDRLVHKHMLKIDHDQGRPGRIEIRETMLRTTPRDNALYDGSGMVPPVSFICFPLGLNVSPSHPGVGASGWSRLAVRKSAHNAGGIGYRKSLIFDLNSLTLRGPGRIAATAGWASGNWSAAATRGTR